jgi:hypothetical protein
MTWPGRVHDVVDALPDIDSIDLRELLHRLSLLSVRGLATMYDARSRSFPHTLRGSFGDHPPVTRGMSVRYTAIAALGLSRTDPSTARDVLGGQDVSVLVPGTLGLALAGRDPGALALSVWAALEVGTSSGDEVLRDQRERLSRALDRLVEHAHAAVPTPTVEYAWTLMALLAARESLLVAELPGGAEQFAEEADRAARRLLVAQAPTGLFPHSLPPDRLGRFRAHVACFPDQAYSIQALVQYAAVTGDRAALDAASRCADRLAALQGEQGQWWWHYDWAKGSAVEGYPVYSVHQHGLAPMALLELWEAGGADHRAAVARGLGWLVRHPETAEDLIADELGVVWRKVGRREPSKFVRKVRSAASARSPALRLPWLDVVFPPGRVDRECRPFELGWLLYAWQPEGLLVSPDGDLSLRLSRTS